MSGMACIILGQSHKEYYNQVWVNFSEQFLGWYLTKVAGVGRKLVASTRSHNYQSVDLNYELFKNNKTK